MRVTYVTTLRDLTASNVQALDNLSMAELFHRPTSTDRASVRTYCVAPAELLEQLHRARRNSQPSVARPLLAVIRKLERFADIAGETWSGEMIVGHVTSHRESKPGRPVETVELPERKPFDQQPGVSDFRDQRSCLHCDATIAREGDLGWVDQLSGDDGGTYDYCPVNPTHRHEPAA